jgi:L-ascorbate metabolism protein UlaG (beta-lactamase superfamily)
MPPVNSIQFGGPLADALRKPVEKLEFYWLGQSGFLFRTPGLNWVIDPYLTDSLAEKYRKHVFSHERMMPVPIAAQELPELDYVFCTHIHGDHLDVPTLASISTSQQKTRFVLPAGIESDTERLPIERDRFIWAEADEPISLSDKVAAIPVKAAHEEFQYDEKGRHRFLGYAFGLEDIVVYHSGDCIPYQGLVEKLRAVRPQLALLPVNGRRKELTEKNILGNFSLAEAVELCLVAGVPALMAQHFGLFAFNTIDPELIEQASLKVSQQLQLLKPEVGTRYTFNSPTRA